MKIHSSPHLFYCNTLLHVKPDMTLHYFSVKLKIKKLEKPRHSATENPHKEL